MCGVKGMKSLKTRVVVCAICGKKHIRNAKASSAKYCDECSDIGNTIRDRKNRRGEIITVEQAKEIIANSTTNKKQLTNLVKKKCIKKNCIVCGKEFLTNGAAKNRAKYCSAECKRDAGHKRNKQKRIDEILNQDVLEFNYKRAKIIDIKDFNYDKLFNSKEVEVVLL